MKIERLEIKDMWSFRKNGGLIKGLGASNLIIGKNNSGKSNILEAVQWFRKNAAWFETGGPIGIPYFLFHRYPELKPGKPSITLRVSLTLHEIQEVLSDVNLPEYGDQWPSIIEGALARGITFHYAEEMLANQFNAKSITVEGHGAIGALPVRMENMRENVQLIEKWQSCTPNVRGKLCKLLTDRIDFIGGWRTLADKAREGKPAIEIVSDWFGAPADQPGMLLKFEKFQQFFLEIIGMRDASVRFEKNSAKMIIIWRGRSLNIGSFGDGIQHLLLLAFEFLQREDNVFLIEELETHLHPTMQRRIWAFARKNSRSQFIVTTHSNVLLDAATTDQVFHVTYDGDKSEIAPAFSQPKLRDILDDIGARPSDILQSNVVIWVEGPTDRLFFDKCIQLVQQNADENEMTVTRGFHYEIAFYGGSTGSYLTLCDEYEEDEQCEKIKNLINLMNLCRNVVFICDSDKESADGAITPWKERIGKECEKGDNKKRTIFWATEGREIENYIPDRVLTEVYRELLAVDTLEVTLDKFQDIHEVVAALRSKAPEAHKWKTDYDDNKARHMKALVPKLTEGDLDQHGLRTK
ncbi:MAG: AAA family ATPase [Planctomycetes bacterium]|nr:AAA family ATPase [Planctomycetota bacterium]